MRNLNILWDFDGTLFDTYPVFTFVMHDLLGGRITEEEILNKGADHAIKVHDLKAEDIFFEQTPCNFLCQTLSKLSRKKTLY